MYRADQAWRDELQCMTIQTLVERLKPNYRKNYKTKMQNGLVLIDFIFKEFESHWVSPRQKLITTILLLSFGFLFFKDLFPSLFENGYDNCFELGHIHKNGGDCHEAKSVFSYSLFPQEILFQAVVPFVVRFDLVLIVKNNFETPYLEPFRKPPRSV